MGSLVTKDDVIDVTDIEVLTDEEEQEFDELEVQGEHTAQTMLDSAREFGRILSVIKDKEYFRKARKDNRAPVFDKFEDYVKWRFNRGRTMGYNYIAIHQVMSALEESDIDPNELRTVSNAIIVADEVKRMLKLEQVEQDQVDNLTKLIVVKSCQLIFNTAPIDETGKPLLEREHIDMVFDTLKTVVRDQVVEIDGEQHPVTLQQLAVEDQITVGLKEQIERRKQLNFEEYAKRLDGKKEPKEIISRAPERVISEDDYFSVTCPKHGVTTPVSLVNAGFWTYCGCLAIMEEIEVGHQEFVWTESREVEPVIEPTEN